MRKTKFNRQTINDPKLWEVKNMGYGTIVAFSDLAIGGPLAVKSSSTEDGVMVADAEATAYLPWSRFNDLMTIAAPVVLVDDAEDIYRRAKMANLPSNSFYPLRVAMQLLGEDPGEIPLSKGVLEYERTRAQLYMKGLSRVAELEFALTPIIAEVNTTGVALHISTECQADECHFTKFLGINGRVQPRYAQIGAVTGRITASNPPLQGLAKRSPCRQCLRPEAGNVFLHADYSQFEMRILAQVTGDADLLNLFRAGQDVHVLTAAQLLGKEPAAITTDERNLAKTFNFGLVFGMGPASFVSEAKDKYGITVSLEQAKVFSDRFYAGYPGVSRWRSLIYQEMPRELRTPLGRRRIFYPSDSPAARLNYIIQATGSDLFKSSLLAFDHQKRPQWKIVALIHDALVVEVPKDDASEAADVLRSTLAVAKHKFLPDVPLVVDIKLLEHL